MSDGPGTRKRNPRGKGDRLRTEIVEAAVRLIDAGGAPTVTLRGVAREAGISAPSIYDHFTDVGQILQAVVERFLGQLESELRAAIDQHRDPVARLMAGCGAYLTFSERHPQRYAVLFRLRVTPEDFALPETAAQPFETLVEGIADCVAAGRSTSADPRRDATAVWSALHGYASLHAVVRSFPWPPREDTLSRIVTGLARITDPAG